MLALISQPNRLSFVSESVSAIVKQLVLHVFVLNFAAC